MFVLGALCFPIACLVSNPWGRRRVCQPDSFGMFKKIVMTIFKPLTSSSRAWMMLSSKHWREARGSPMTDEVRANPGADGGHFLDLWR
jgi:hypothetical protein